MKWDFHTYMAQPAWFINAIVAELNDRATEIKKRSKRK